MRPLRRADVTTRDLDSETLILDRRHQEVHHLNPSASYVWQCCDGRKTVGQIASSMAQEFGIEVEDAQRDVVSLLSQLNALHLLESG